MRLGFAKRRTWRRRKSSAGFVFPALKQNTERTKPEKPGTCRARGNPATMLQLQLQTRGNKWMTMLLSPLVPIGGVRSGIKAWCKMENRLKFNRNHKWRYVIEQFERDGWQRNQRQHKEAMTGFWLGFRKRVVLTAVVLGKAASSNKRAVLTAVSWLPVLPAVQSKISKPSRNFPPSAFKINYQLHNKKKATQLSPEIQLACVSKCKQDDLYRDPKR